MSIPAQRGARVHARQRAPSVDLVRLIELLTRAISVSPDPTSKGKPASWPLFDYDARLKRWRVNTRGVLSRLYSNDAFNDEFRHGDDRGFLRDVVLPNRGAEAKMGGRVLVERLPDLARATTELKEVIAAELVAACARSGASLTGLVTDDANQYLSELARNVGAIFRDEMAETNLVPIQFANAERSFAEREDDVARLIAAVEEVESGDWLRCFEKPVRRKLALGGLQEDEIDGVIANVQREAARLDSQLVRFLNFLDDEALARVRLGVTFAIMTATCSAARIGRVYWTTSASAEP